MTSYIALLRAVNVGGTGKLPMTELREMCESLGFEDVRTYIASGNVVFRSDRDASTLKAALEERLREYAGKPVGVMIRTATEMAEVHTRNPFPDEPGNWTLAIFLDEPPAHDAIESVKNRETEQIELGVREIYVAYGEGMGRSRLSIPAAKSGTARNMNTVAKLASMAMETASARDGEQPPSP